MNYSDDALREIRITALWALLQNAHITRENKRLVWAAMARELNARSENQIASMERRQGLRA